MAITNDFMDAVQSGKVIRVRIMLKDSLLVDPTGSQFEEMEHYATEIMDNVYTEHDGEELNFDITAWNEDYLNEEMVTVVNSFSKERIELLKSMVRYLYKDKVNKIHKEKENTSSNHKISRKQVGVGVTATGAVLSVAGLCTEYTALTIGGVLVAAAGVALIVCDKENK